MLTRKPYTGNQGWRGSTDLSEFLETALLRAGNSDKRFENIQAMVDRCLSLYNNRFNAPLNLGSAVPHIRNNLLQQLAKINEKIKREDNDLQTFDEAMITTLLDHNLSVNILQVMCGFLSLTIALLLAEET